MKKTILLITPENKEINKFRKKQVNNFIQITMPYLAGFIDETKYNMLLIDEYNQKMPFEDDFDLIAILDIGLDFSFSSPIRTISLKYN